VVKTVVELKRCERVLKVEVKLESFQSSMSIENGFSVKSTMELVSVYLCGKATAKNI
jgi:hypothetical protein